MNKQENISEEMVLSEDKRKIYGEFAEELRKDYPFLSEGESLLFIQDLYEFLERYFFLE